MNYMQDSRLQYRGISSNVQQSVIVKATFKASNAPKLQLVSQTPHCTQDADL